MLHEIANKLIQEKRKFVSITTHHYWTSKQQFSVRRMSAELEFEQGTFRVKESTDKGKLRTLAFALFLVVIARIFLIIITDFVIVSGDRPIP